MKRKNTLTILISLLSLSLIALVAWYFFIYRCNQIPSKYNIFSKYITSNSCQKTSISMQGILYNMRKEGENLTFDLSVWNKDTKESEEIKNITIPFNENIQKELANTKYIAPVEISFDIQKKYKYLVILQDNGKEEWVLKKIGIAEEKYLQTIKNLYSILTDKSLTINGETYDFPILSQYILENEEIKNLQTVGYKDLASLYRPYIQILTKENKNSSLNSLLAKELNLKEYMNGLNQYIKNELSSTSEETKEEDKDSVLISEYTYFGACSLVKEIVTQTKLSEEEKSLLVKEYCNFGNLEETLANIKKLNLRYTINDLIGNINTYNLAIKERDESAADVTNPYLASDLLSFADLTGNSNTSKSDIYNLASISTANTLLSEAQIYLKDFCELMYSEYLTEKNFDLKRNIPENMFRTLLDQDTSKMVEYMSEEIESGLLCMLSEHTDIFVSEFYNSILTKYLLVDVYARQGRENGIWDGNTFKITDNARLYELLLRQYEDTK
ncbi:MAG: hypothetical protein AB9915_02780 [Candidatus Dojkabacteria bacterium]